MALEDLFAQKAEEWKTHCYNNSYHSNPHFYLDCDAYRSIITLGPQALPLIKEQLQKEVALDQKYHQERDRLKLKVLGTTDIELKGEPYFKILKDPEYQLFEINYKNEIMGNPGIYWCNALKAIIPEFALPIGERGSGLPVERIGGFVALNVDAVKQATIQWLEENMGKYVQKE